MRVQGSGFRVLGFRAQGVKIALLFLRFRLFVRSIPPIVMDP